MNSHLSAMLRPYQRPMADFILNAPRGALWAEMGVGKTLSTLAALWELWAAGEFTRGLIIGPKRVAEETWPDEITKWGEALPCLSLTVLKGTPAQRAKRLGERTVLDAIDRDLVPWLVKHLGGPDRWPYDVVVIDEASGYKSPASIRFKRLRPVAMRTHRIIELTGTPQPNDLLDVWAPTCLLDEGKRLGRSMGAYKEAYFESDYMGWNYTPKPWAREAIVEKLADITLPVRAKDCIDLPPLTEIDVPITLPPAARKVYAALERHAVAALEGGANVVANGAAVLSSKLRQVASGWVFDDAGGRTALHSVKLDALRDLVEAADGAPMLVAYTYTAERDAILEAFPAARTIDTPNASRDFNAGTLPMLVIHPASAGHGLNLQGAASIVVWFGLTWSAEEYLQTNARLHRSGQRNAVRVYRLVAKDTVDEDVVDVVMGKKASEADLVRAILQRKRG